MFTSIRDRKNRTDINRIGVAFDNPNIPLVFKQKCQGINTDFGVWRWYPNRCGYSQGPNALNHVLDDLQQARANGSRAAASVDFRSNCGR